MPTTVQHISAGTAAASPPTFTPVPTIRLRAQRTQVVATFYGRKAEGGGRGRAFCIRHPAAEREEGGGAERDTATTTTRDKPTASAPAAGTGTRRVRPCRADVWPSAVGAAGREMGTTRLRAGARKAAARAAAAGGIAAEECVGAAAGTRPPAAEREERISAPPTPPKRRPQPPPPDARKKGPRPAGGNFIVTASAESQGRRA